MKFETKVKKEWMNLIFNSIFMVVSVIVVVLFYRNLLLTNVLLLIIAGVGLIRWKSKLSLFIFLVFGISFGLAENIISGLGPWTYKVTDIFNSPSWLFILWGNTAVFIHQMIREVRKLGIKEESLS